MILSNSLPEIDEPEEDEIEAIKEFEKRKKAGKLELNEFID